MRALLRECWLWIAIPTIVTTAGILVIRVWRQAHEPAPICVYSVF